MKRPGSALPGLLVHQKPRLIYIAKEETLRTPEIREDFRGRIDYW